MGSMGRLWSRRNVIGRGLGGVVARTLALAVVLMAVVLPQTAGASWKKISQTPTTTEPYYACPRPQGARLECQLIVDPSLGRHVRGPVKEGTVTKGPVEELSPAYEGEGFEGGYSPQNIQSAYGLTAAASESGSNQTVAVVDPYNDPVAEENLAVYRREYGLGECTKSNGCFRQVNQNGESSPLPSGEEPEYVGEITLDIDMVSAVCPKCHILLVEANNNLRPELEQAEKEAVKLGATEVSNSISRHTAFRRRRILEGRL